MIIRPEAEADMAEARAFYEGRSEGLGDAFLASVEQILTSIEAMPDVHAVIHRDVRRVLIRRFPFSIYYRVEAGQIIVLAVIHSRRNPRDWKSRA